MPEVAIIFIRNSSGDLFLHQRLPTKRTFPDKYGIGAGGHVDPGENPTQAAIRELYEETTLQTPLEYICTVDFDESDFKERAHLFVTVYDGDIQTDASEWQWSGWMTRAQVDDLRDAGKLCTDTAEMYRRYLETPKFA